MSSKHIFIIPEGGLCNRMRVINGGLDLSQKLGTKSILIWCRDKSLNSTYSDLFQQLDIKTYETDRNSFLYKLLLFYAKKIKQCIVLDDHFILEHFRGTFPNSFNKLIGNNIIINSCQSVTLSEDFSMFKISDDISHKILKIDNRTIGIHIRRTDNKMSVQYSPTKLFIQKIEEEIAKDKTIKFYLATDDLNEENYIKQKFNDKILTYPKTSLDRNNPQAIKEAVIDLYHLSKCKKIYASYYSSFSDVAAMWGNIEKEVVKLNE